MPDQFTLTVSGLAKLAAVGVDVTPESAARVGWDVEAFVATDRVVCNRCGWDDHGALREVETVPADGTQHRITYETDGQRVDFCGGCEAPLGPETIAVLA